MSSNRNVALPDWAPFAVPDEELWREAQRRRRLIKMVEELSHLARDEGLATSHELLAATAERLRHLLLQSPAPAQAAPRTAVPGAASKAVAARPGRVRQRRA